MEIAIPAVNFAPIMPETILSLQRSNKIVLLYSMPHRQLMAQLLGLLQRER